LQDRGQNKWALHGWLLGRDRGEWGGELVFLGADGKQSILMEDNIVGIFRLGSEIVAVGGTAHLNLAESNIFRVTMTANGQWTAYKWLTLPGAPGESLLKADGRLFVSTTEGGLIISQDGKIEMEE
jgi:hypothetical protein